MNQLDDLDFADDIALLSHSSEQMQTKTNRLNSFSQSTGLKINIKKTKLWKINTGNEDTITVEENPVEAACSSGAFRAKNPLFLMITLLFFQVLSQQRQQAIIVVLLWIWNKLPLWKTQPYLCLQN